VIESTNTVSYLAMALRDRRSVHLHRVEMRLAVRLVVAQGGIGAADEHCEVAAILPGARANGVARPAFDGQIARFKVEEQSIFGGQRPEQRCFADAGLAENAALDATLFGKSLVCGDDRECHCAPPFLPVTASTMLSLPSAPFERASL
jgi:hypothetical protein